MEILKSEQYINEKLDIKPVSKDRLDSFLKEPEVDDETKRFIKDNSLVWNPLTKRYDCNGDVKISKDIVLDGKLKIKFGHVKGYFNCRHNELTALEGAPQKVGGYFICSYNKLTTLDGAPNEVGGNFYCGRNNLTTLDGAPRKVGGNFDCSYNELTTLDGTTQEVDGNFYCSNNPKLVLPNEKPSWVKGELITK